MCINSLCAPGQIGEREISRAFSSLKYIPPLLFFHLRAFRGGILTFSKTRRMYVARKVRRHCFHGNERGTSPMTSLSAVWCLCKVVGSVVLEPRSVHPRLHLLCICALYDVIASLNLQHLDARALVCVHARVAVMSMNLCTLSLSAFVHRIPQSVPRAREERRTVLRNDKFSRRRAAILSVSRSFARDIANLLAHFIGRRIASISSGTLFSAP